MGVRPTKLHGKLDALGGVGASARRFRLPIRAKLGRFSTLTICAKPIRKDLFAGGPRAMAGFHAEVAGSSSDATTTLRNGSWRRGIGAKQRVSSGQVSDSTSVGATSIAARTSEVSWRAAQCETRVQDRLCATSTTGPELACTKASSRLHPIFDRHLDPFPLYYTPGVREFGAP
jgi:hypothetical protein